MAEMWSRPWKFLHPALLRACRALLFVLASIATVSAQAEERAAPDVSLEKELQLPELPVNFATVRSGALTFELPQEARSILAPVIADAADLYSRVAGPLGASAEVPIRVRVGRDWEQMRALAPVTAPPPSYAVGVAYPAARLILLSLTDPQTFARPDLGSVLAHELSHVALGVAIEDGFVPRWFTEGLAIHQAREHSFERVQILWSATVRGGLLPMSELSAGFPDRPGTVSLAYAQSADFIAFLLERSGDAAFAALIDRMRRQRFEDAISQTYSAGLGQLEVEWRERLDARFTAWPLFLGTGAIWGLIAVLMALAWWRKRRSARAIVKRWEREDAVYPDPPTALDEPEAELALETRVPKIVVDGNAHTLH